MGETMENVDVLIIGSGFGGSVMACRMAEKGSQVVVLERGRRWLPEAYPSVSQRDWFWDHRCRRWRWFPDLRQCQH